VSEIALLLNRRDVAAGEAALYRNIYGDLFFVNVLPSGIHVWSVNGGDAIVTIAATTTSEILRTLEDRTREYSSGVLRCADCGTPMRRFSEEIAGQYFAGRYCKSCWEREWRGRAARETYE
jgi:hypothetical protein